MVVSVKVRITAYVLLVSIVLILFGLRFLNNETGISARGGELLDVQIALPVYSQKDERWSQLHLGNTQEPMSDVGCTVCCAAMALASQGIDYDPAQLNDLLIRNDGFTERGWLIWDVVRIITQDKFEIQVASELSHAEIDVQLK